MPAFLLIEGAREDSFCYCIVQRVFFLPPPLQGWFVLFYSLWCCNLSQRFLPGIFGNLLLCFLGWFCSQWDRHFPYSLWIHCLCLSSGTTAFLLQNRKALLYSFPFRIWLYDRCKAKGKDLLSYFQNWVFWHKVYCKECFSYRCGISGWLSRL